MQKFIVVINKSSGTVLKLGVEKVEALIRDHLGDRVLSLHLLESAEMTEKLKSLTLEKPEAVLVGGGDGTAVAAAELLGSAGVPFGVLPLGTMNLLAQDLGSAPTFEETLKRVQTFKPDMIDVGLVNGRMFLCSAVIGLVPEGAVVREEIRESVSLEAVAKFVTTIARGMIGESSQKLHLRAKEADPPVMLDTTALIISNNSFIRNPSDPASRFSRDTLSDGKLAVYSAAPRDMMDGLRMAFSLWQGDWQDHESIFSFSTPEMIVQTEKENVLISLDGEPMEMQNPLRFSIVPKALPVLRMELAAAE